VHRSIQIPREVLDALAKDETVVAVLKNENVAPEKLPSSWFSASGIHLSRSDKFDLIVKGEMPILGANVTTFWVFLATGEQHKLALTRPAHDLVVESKRWNGYRQVSMVSISASKIHTTRYRFDGVRYLAFRERSESVH